MGGVEGADGKATFILTRMLRTKGARKNTHTRTHVNPNTTKVHVKGILAPDGGRDE